MGKSTTPNTPQLAGATLDVCLLPTKPASNSIPLTRVQPSGEPNVLLRAVIGGSTLTSVGQNANSIPIEHGPAPSKSSYRKCSGVRHSVTPKNFGAGAFPIKPKDMWDLSTKHWWYTNSSTFPYLYDFTLNAWIYYFPDTHNAGRYTTNPRWFANMTTGQIFTM